MILVDLDGRELRLLGVALDLLERRLRDDGIRAPEALSTLRAVLSRHEPSSRDEVAAIVEGLEQRPPLLVDSTEAARLLAVSVSTVERMVRDDEIGSVRIGRSRRIPVAELERLARKDSDGTTNPHPEGADAGR